MIKQELDVIKKYIVEGVENLLPDDLLTKFVAGRSKMVRSKMGLLYAKVFKIQSENIYPLLAATELIHNASLLHDDVIDDAEKRRGKTTINNEYSSNVSILCGDYLVGKAIEKLLLLDNNAILDMFNKCVQNMAKAEIKQFFMRGKLPSLDEYIEICEGKTASLFVAMLKSIDLVLNIQTDSAEQLGKLFGIYFQLKNDMDMFSSKEDKKNGIYTAADILGVEKANALLDNYRGKVIKCIRELPKNEYRDELEGLIINYDR